MNISPSQTSILVKQLFDRDSFTYTYLIADPNTREGAIIDPVKEKFDRDMQIIEELGIELLYSIETHAHADHITSAGRIRQNTGAKIVFSTNANIQSIDIALDDSDELALGYYKIRGLATPGHTSGCMCYYIDGIVFTGDTLLIRGCGRTDFQAGHAGLLYDNIQKKIFTLPDSTRISPGHDYNGRTSSTVAEEKRWNPRVGQGRTRAEFTDIMNNLNLDLPKKMNEAVPANVNVGVNFHPRRYVHEEFNMDDLYGIWQAGDPKILIVDNRSPSEYEQGHVPGSKNIPLGDEESAIEELNDYDQVYIYCRSGRRAQTAYTNLGILGLDHLTCISHSGMPEWQKNDYPVEK